MFIQHLEDDKIINGGSPFIIQDLDELGLFVLPEVVQEIEDQVSDMLDKNHFDEQSLRKR